MQPRLLQCRVANAERVYLAYVDDLDEWPEAIDVGSRYFISLVAMDARDLKDQKVVAFVDRLLDQGLANVHFFGPDCGRVHVLFDQACLRREDRGIDHPDAMTSDAEAEDID